MGSRHYGISCRSQARQIPAVSLLFLSPRTIRGYAPSLVTGIIVAG
jgi:hypothetical protein